MDEKIVKDSQGLAKDLVNDCISRQAAIDAVMRNACNTQRIYEAIKGLPSEQPERTEKRTKTHACDLISRAAAIDAVRTYYDDEYALADSIEELIEKLPSAQPEQRWIPCSERLPKEEKKTYWVCTDTEYQCECRWTNNRFGFGEGEWGWSIFDTPQYSKPIAWQPLPTPYREGE